MEVASLLPTLPSSKYGNSGPTPHFIALQGLNYGRQIQSGIIFHKLASSFMKIEKKKYLLNFWRESRHTFTN